VNKKEGRREGQKEGQALEDDGWQSATESDENKHDNKAHVMS